MLTAEWLLKKKKEKKERKERKSCVLDCLVASICGMLLCWYLHTLSK